MEYKYPYIDREYYPAVMGACSMIRATGAFNRAVKYYAKKYSVDSKRLEEYIRERQAAGQKGKSRQYKYYLICYSRGYADEGFYPPHRKFIIVKATNQRNAENRLWRHDITGDSDYTSLHYHIGETQAFDTREEAEDALIKEERDGWK